MLWYNNPDAVAAHHDHYREERYEAMQRRSVLRIARADDATVRH